jgi:hypothetical protein
MDAWDEAQVSALRPEVSVQDCCQAAEEGLVADEAVQQHLPSVID